MAKARESSGGLRAIHVTIGGNRGGSTVALMSPINRGKSVNLRPSDRVISEMKSRGMTKVKAYWEVDKDGQAKTLTITPTSADEPGLRIRYDNSNLRPHIHIPTADVGKATMTDTGISICKTEEIYSDGEFMFSVPTDMRFERGGHNE